MREINLYAPIKAWLQVYLENKYKKHVVITVDAHAERLDRVLRRLDIKHDVATGVDIQIDVLGVVRSNKGFRFFFVEAKSSSLTLRDLGQLWAYCKLIDPEEAFLMTSAGLGSLNKILNIHNREDLLDFGDGKKIKKMKIVIWNLSTNSPDLTTMIPKM